ncbi:FMN-dependent dehydrogenase-domain-containing protein [Sparassis latifolia]|uniref:L-lactate dehydrogenase (cytochrome) n=1 Tax=Sparassis crispa TaxID=139825 RepID=A0A401GZI8_9APHY|nr:Cytochrome b2, mitochondrial [Sparassis crispa]GBE87570.1 Cytochrome b2, mitochondrial [Sparassis crispa]
MSFIRVARFMRWGAGRRAFSRSALNGQASRTRLVTGIISAGIVLGVYTGHSLSHPLNLDSASSDKKSAAHGDSAPKYISYQEVQKHNTPGSCWVIIEGQVYDATSVLKWHPAGPTVILKNSGRDATKAFLPVHPPDTLSHLPPEAHLGPVDPATVPVDHKQPTEEEIRIAKVKELLPPPSAALNLNDIEKFAHQVLTKTAWAYYRSTADDDSSYAENIASFKRFWFRPRVLTKSFHVSTATSMLSFPASLPIFIAPAALARLGHPDGEMNLVRAAGKEGILLGISNNASCSTDECMSAALPGQNLIFQVYLNKDRSASEALIKRVEKQGFKAVMFTVDASVPGKRELDQRAKEDFTDMPAAYGKSETGLTGGLGVAHAISGYQDPELSWEDIPWIRSLTKLPVIVKGIQCVEDAEKAFAYGAQAIILSNHGGRELDYAPAPMTILYEMHQQRPDLLREHEVYIDGGVTRGTDVLKALCLGARGVGLGRAFLYANGVWGETGCRRVIQIMREEIETGMRLLGVTRIDLLTPKLVRYVDRDLPRPRL